MTKQKVLITAGASGIGYATALAFSSRGADVTVADIDNEGLNRLHLEHPGIRTAVCYVSDRRGLELDIAVIIEAMGGLDVLVNNAGVSGPTAPVEQLEPDEWDKVMQINLKVPSTLRAWPSLRSNVRYTPQSLTCLLLRADWATQIAPPTRPVNEG